MRLLLIYFVFAGLALSNPVTNVWARGTEVSSTSNSLSFRDTLLTVYPTDSQDPDQLLEAHDFLQGLYGENHVEFDPEELVWKISLQNDATTDALKEYPLVSLDKETAQAKYSAAGHGDPWYIVNAANPEDDEQTKATFEFLKSKAENTDEKIYPFHKPGTDHVMGWGNIQLTSEAKAAVEAYEGIKAPLGEDYVTIPDRAVTRNEHVDLQETARPDEFGLSRRALKSVKKRYTRVKRALTYTKQANAPAHLVMLSQPSEMKDDKLKDFVYDENAGAGTYIYVIDTGAAYNVKNNDGNNEFEKIEAFQTAHSKDHGEKEDEDGSDISHGTMVSSQALGRKYGVAKAATLVSVKMTSKFKDLDAKMADFILALEAVTTHLESRPERHSKSVVTCSHGWKIGMDHKKAETDPAAINMRVYLDRLFEMGVPFISSSGNLGHLFKTIDKLPKVLEDPDTPIINVGAVDADGSTPIFSQTGPQLTISAPGVGIAGQKKEDGKEGIEEGTSHSAPLVAGVIATYLNYEPLPWGESYTGKERVQAIKDYIVTDKSSWIRKAGSDIRVIWNGATKENHKNAEANQFSAPAPDPAPSQLTTPPPPTQALSIILQNYIDEISNTNSWLFFFTAVGVSALCKSDKEAVLQSPTAYDPAMVDNPPWPGGTFPLKLDGMDCEYKNDGGNPGALWCNGRSDAIPCRMDLLKGVEKGKVCDQGLWTIAQHPVVLCEW